MGTFWRNLLSEHVLFRITFVNACTHRRKRWEPFVRARFVYNNIRKRLHVMGTFWRNLLSEHVLFTITFVNACTPLSTVGTFWTSHFNHGSKARQKWKIVCPGMRTVNNNNISTFQPLFKSTPKWCVVCPGMPTVNNDVISTLPQHAHCQWECFGGAYCSLGTFGNLLEESIVLWEPLGTFGNLHSMPTEESIVLGNLWEPLGTFGNIYCLSPEAPVTSTAVQQSEILKYARFFMFISFIRKWLKYLLFRYFLD